MDGEAHPASDFAYVPDPEKPSTWKLPIFNMRHVGGALAAMTSDYRGDPVEIPEGDRRAVMKKMCIRDSLKGGRPAPPACPSPHWRPLWSVSYTHLARLRKAGKQIVLLGPVPEWTFGPRKLMRRNALLNANRTDRLLGGDFNTRQRPVFALLEHMESTGLCRFIPLHGTFHKNGRWLAEDLSLIHISFSIR